MDVMLGGVADPVYDVIGVDYARQRRPDPRWQAEIDAVLGRSKTIVNVGAGTGSYEPDDRYVLAVEPSTAMIRQRRAGAPPALQASAEDLPIADAQFDVALALVTIHHWLDWEAGLREMRRVANRLVVLHFDPALHCDFWLVRDYLPELNEIWSAVPTVEEGAP
ncbi:MAG: class I SAM-dependent methyltransferase, partial [Nocardioides sp.]|nr:class I SAM-dependent methyltransferase [Nocardioides sp.]